MLTRHFYRPSFICVVEKKIGRIKKRAKKEDCGRAILIIYRGDDVTRRFGCLMTSVLASSQPRTNSMILMLSYGLVLRQRKRDGRKGKGLWGKAVLYKLMGYSRRVTRIDLGIECLIDQIIGGWITWPKNSIIPVDMCRSIFHSIYSQSYQLESHEFQIRKRAGG